MRGRKPKPTKLKIAEGDPGRVGKRKLEERLRNEPKAVRGFPPCPAHLVGVARKAWKFLAEQIAVMEQDRRPDAFMLEGACVNYAHAVKADQILERDGLTVEESIIDEATHERIVTGVKKHPAVAISNAAWLRVRAFCSEFGLSPVSRTRLAVKAEESGDDDLMKILASPRESKPLVQ